MQHYSKDNVTVARRWFRAIVFLVIVSPILSSCAADRKVVGSTFQSSYPPLNIQIDSKYKYLGTTSLSSLVKAYNSQNTILNHSEWHIFIPQDSPTTLERFIYIQIEKTQNYFINTLPESKSNLDFGMINLFGENYQYFSRIETTRVDWQVNKYIMDSGYSLPSCMLYRRFSKFTYKDMRVVINYGEGASDAVISCKSLIMQEKSFLSKTQQALIEELHGKALAAIGAVDTAAKKPAITAPKKEPTKVELKPAQVIIKKPEFEKPQKVVTKGKKVKVGIVEFQNINDEAEKVSLGLVFSEMLTAAFVDSEAFEFTEREQLQKVATELQLSQSSIIDTSQAKQLGKTVGADAIITGSVTKIGTELRLYARIIDVQSGIILTDEKNIGKTDLYSISSMAARIVNNLVNKFYRDNKPH